MMSIYLRVFALPIGRLLMRMSARAVFACLLAMLLSPTRLQAQELDGLEEEFAAISTLQRDELEEEFEFLEDQDIVYTAAKHEQDISDSPSTITVITREQIENSTCMDIPCLLRQVPEIEVRILKPMQIAIGARALVNMESDAGLVLVDGRDIVNEVMGMPFWGALPLHISEVERIEVIRGPGSALYGANAHSMVISIVTRTPKSSGSEFYFAGGEHGSESLHARISQLLGDWKLQFAGGLEDADHWRISGQKEQQVYRTNFKLEKSDESYSARLQLGYMNIEGMLYSPLASMEVRSSNQTNASLIFENKWLRSQLWFDYTASVLVFDLPLFYRKIKLGTFPELIDLKTAILDSDTQFTWSPYVKNLLLAGIEYRFLGMMMPQNDPSSVYQHRIGVFLQDEQILWQKLLLSGAIRFDYNTLTPFTVSPRLAVSWRFDTLQILRFTFGRAFRKPSFMQSSIHFSGVKGTSAFPELEDFFQRSVGNQDLDNESITAFELGYRGQFFKNQLVVEGDLFWNLYRSDIGFTTHIATNSMGLPDLKNSVLRFTNFAEDVDSLGGSVSLTYRVQSAWWINLNYTYRYSMYVNRPDDDDSPYQNYKRIKYEPAHLFNLVCEYQSPAGLRVALSANGRSSADYNIHKDGELFGEIISRHHPANIYFDFMVGWRIQTDSRWLELGIRVFNLVNNGFRDMPPILRFDGVETGSELMSRKGWLYLRGVI
jgi:outer membrane receptor for ferrienterochelin and colicin